MKIRIEPHTIKRAVERGASENEIVETLQTGQPIIAKGNRLAKSKIFIFQQNRNGRFYEEKKLEVFYIVENDEIITITVYVFFGKF
jgi:hypothetical protein